MLSIYNGTQWQQVQEKTYIGDHFAFFPANCLAGSELAWLATVLQGGLLNPARVLPLWSQTPVALPGATHSGANRFALGTAVVTSDKSIYETLSDQVHLLVTDPYHGGRRAVLKIMLDGSEFQQHPLVLDRHGCGEVLLTQLPVGRYTSQVVTETETSPECTFTVAEYRLVPLVANFLERRSEGSKFHFRLRLESFGLATEGQVIILLMDDQLVSQHQVLLCQCGEVSGTVELSGAGPFSLSLQLQADPSRTASLPIVGSRQHEREKTLISQLGRMVEASLLPGANSIEVRGLFLEEGAMRNSPLRLERVDTRRLRLVAATDLKGLLVCLADPTFPGLAAPTCTMRQPDKSDPFYQKGFLLYRQGHYQDSGSIFEKAWRQAAFKGQPIHPYYAYNAACCWALQGRTEEALLWLEQALRDGLKEWDMIKDDKDLASLIDHPRYQSICRGGLTTQQVGDLAAGQALEIDLEGSLAMLAVGAFVADQPWEGRALIIAPESISPSLELPASAQVGESLTIQLRLPEPTSATAYVVVKDARLLSTDTPTSRLAERIKNCADRWQQLPPSEGPPPTMAKLRNDSRAHSWQAATQSSTSPSYDPFSQAWAPTEDSQPTARPVSSRSYASYSSSDPFASSSDPFGASSDPFVSGSVDPFGSSSDPFGSANVDPFASSSDPFASAASDPFASAADPFASPSMDPFAAAVTASAEPPVEEASVQAPAAAPLSAQPQTRQQPQTLFAGAISMSDGLGQLQVSLPDQAVTLVVEVLVLAQRDWKRLEGRCLVQSDPYISLEVSPFAQPGDCVFGKLEVGSPSQRELVMELRLDDQPVSLEAMSPQTWRFPVKPGLYTCQVSAKQSDQVWRQEARVQAPGKFVSLAKSLEVLQAGESLSRQRDENILDIRVLAGLDQPFRVCAEATANYGHACCEQTAAKMVAACALWVFGQEGEQARAASIITAGIQRLQSMWLRGQGFRTYPHSPAVRDTYWGPRAARYLWVLNSLQSAPQMARDVELGIQMAKDTSWAYGIIWPPQHIQSSEDAYWALRYQPNQMEARRYLESLQIGDNQPGVQFRIEAAYAAAAMILVGIKLPVALQLANRVTRAFNQEGRLYSTADSVAAIALLMTMKQRGIGVSQGRVVSGGEAHKSLDLIGQSLQDIMVEEGTVAVQVSRLVTEDWSGFHSQVPLQVSLQRNGLAGWRFATGDSVELVVALEGEYVNGDLVWVCLPDCLSRVLGGAQLKLFSVDLQGSREVRIGLAVTGETGAGSQSFGVCVRNMYDEARIGNAGLLSLTVRKN